MGKSPVQKDYSLSEFCRELSVSEATGRNWIRLGKIRPDREVQGKPRFSRTYTEKILKKLQKKDAGFLQARRNKKHLTGNAIDRNYIPKDSPNLKKISRTAAVLAGISQTDLLLRAVLAECALQLLCQAYGIRVSFEKYFLSHYLEGEIALGQYGELVQELFPEGKEAYAALLTAEQKTLFQTAYVLEPNADILGLLYISLKNLRERKAAGSYYTPAHIVRKMTADLQERNGGNLTILDPCCGTGNFLLQLPEHISLEQIAGRDIDALSILLARINLALKFKDAPVSLLRTQIRRGDFLLEEDRNAYDLILGNPPWGFQFEQKAGKLLKQKFCTAKGKHMESYELFLEEAVNRIPVGGAVAFVLPEAVLHVKSHLEIRKFLMERVQIEELDYLGEVFGGVQCPSIILKIRKTESPLDTCGMKVSDRNRQFEIQVSRKVEAENFNFSMTDEEYELVEKLISQKNMAFLKNQAEFALGIVTGNNRELVQKQKGEQGELVLKGADIFKYKIGPGNAWLTYEPEKFQQCAKTEIYRAPEKLFYRFVGNQLVFAYDNQQRLSLNSCNILIPRMGRLQIKYIMAVLNSRISQFIYRRKFHSLKVLRSSLEQLPIPVLPEEEQKQVILLADQIALEEDPAKWMEYYNAIDGKVAAACGLTAQEYEKILAYESGEK
ncbi:MAG: N-6 DNA methylase [Lachnospiraceae bacterium]|jgi:type I restriction-modification system DNA methylase subunit|nr:N-6 DNA methylase [Lachnospiraceae bacterium]MCI9059801.1 N-6 DNA methylase [Lachnospiraceae bacterium]